LIGKEFLNWQKPVNMMKSRLIYLSDVIIKSAELAKTIFDQLQLNENAKSSGATLTLERQEEHGKKQDWKLSLKIPTQSGGAAIETRQMLSSMNLTDKLHSITCQDGLIVIHVIWKVSMEQLATVSKEYGSPPMWTHVNGTRTTTNNNKSDCLEDSTSTIIKKEFPESPSMDVQNLEQWTQDNC